MQVHDGDRIALVGRNGSGKSTMAGEPTATAVLRAATGLEETEARTALAAFGLSAEEVERPASTLPRRAHPRRTGPGRPPPRHLPAARRADQPPRHRVARSVLEAALADWPGALVVATHDATFSAALRLTREVYLQ